jgi:hypothetical protein
MKVKLFPVHDMKLYFGVGVYLHSFLTKSLGCMDKKNHGRTTYQPDLTTFLQPRHIPKQGYNITQSSAPDDGHMVARNMLSNY